MDWSVILNVLFGTGLVATIVGLFSIRSELKKARAEAEKAMADADTVKITNTESATRILIDNIVKPLTEKLDETHRELSANKRELMRFRKAIESIQVCPYRGECPVVDELQEPSSVGGRVGVAQKPAGQRKSKPVASDRLAGRGGSRLLRQRGRAAGATASDRQSADRRGVQRSDSAGSCIVAEERGEPRDSDSSGRESGEGDG